MVASITNDLSTDTTVIKANQFPVKSVKLFSSGSAEITRTFPLSFLRLQDEPQVVEIFHLPAGLQSVDVSVASTSGNVAILDQHHTTVVGENVPITPSIPVPYKPSLDPSGTPVIKLLPQISAHSSQRLRELETERLQLEDERRLRQQSFTFLTTYMDSLAQCKSHGQPEPGQMVSFCDDFIRIGITRSAVIAELDSKLADVLGRIKEEKERLAKLSSDLPVKVVTVLSCNSQVPVEAAELTVTYVVRQVSWKPVYDLHIAMTGNTPSSTVRLDFRCMVTQWTGEKWENVSLEMTTADQVSQLIQLPEAKRIDITVGPAPIVIHPPNFPRRPIKPPHEHSDAHREQHDHEPRQITLPVLRGVTSPHATPPAEPAIVQLPMVHPRVPQHQPKDVTAKMSGLSQPISHPKDAAPKVTGPSQTVSQLISHGRDLITHIADGSVFIPSDHAEHHALVASLSLQAQFMHVVVPSADTRVYYACEVKNTSEYVLLPGTVKIYLNDKHVSSTDIHSTELPQILECSLAVDTGVKTTHNQAPDALPSIGAFTGKATTSYMSATVIHNTRAESIRGVIVRSSIPLPADPRITIMLKEPVGLADIDEGSVSVREGCLARWSTTGGRKGKQAGSFEWVCDVNPGTEVLKAVWEVCAPHDLKLSEQVHS